MPRRPHIPKETSREVLVESGYRCVVCGVEGPLEVVPWRNGSLEAENLICLCPSCHQRADVKGWRGKTLGHYKLNPWVKQQGEHLESSANPERREPILSSARVTGLRKLERLATRHLLLSTAILIALVIGGLVTTIAVYPANFDKITKAVDVVLKAGAAIVGIAWALNRYFTTRTDELQLRVDSEVQAIPAGSFKESPDLGMLVGRLDIVNTGKLLIPFFQQRLVVDEVYPTSNGIKEVTLYTWPQTGLHHGGPIEPGSWSAINFSHSIPASSLALRLYLEIYIDGTLRWNWHKTFCVERGSVA